MTATHDKTPLRLRTVWVSDVHLGIKACRADFLLDFLKSIECEYLYLVGDIIDLWSMKKGIYWPQSHNDAIRAILGMAKRGTQVIYIPGNHDELLRDYDGMSFGNVHIRKEAVHTTADGRKLLVIHGDEFDSVVRCGKFLAVFGSHVYEVLLKLNRAFNFFRRKLGFPYWSLAAWIKHKVKNAVNYISDFEKALAREAKRRGVDGLVCGHIHRAEISLIEDTLYCNDGDWVESCTALVERRDGGLRLMHWADIKESMKDERTLVAERAA